MLIDVFAEFFGIDHLGIDILVSEQLGLPLSERLSLILGDYGFKNTINAPNQESAFLFIYEDPTDKELQGEVHPMYPGDKDRRVLMRETLQLAYRATNNRKFNFAFVEK